MKIIRGIVVIFGLQFVVILFTSFIGEHHNKSRLDLVPIINYLSENQNAIVGYFSDYLQQQIDTTKTVGAACALVSHDSVIFLNTYGVKVAGTSDSVDIHTLFRLASVSKGFAGVLASKLQQEGILNLDEKIIESIPGFTLKDTVNTNNLTLRQTLDHTSGLVPHTYDGMVEDGVSFASIIGQLKDVDIAAPPRTGLCISEYCF